MPWHNYIDTHPTNTVVGTLMQHEAIWSPELNNSRDLLVWLPPDYEHSTRHYPVLYFHDGQNLFDRFTSFVGEWHVDETMQSLSHEGYPAIIVGIPNRGAQRVLEYSPFTDARFGKGQGDQYLAFVAETVKPLFVPGSVYLDIGGQEGPVSTSKGQKQPNQLLRLAREMNQLLQRKGYRPGANLLYIEAEEAGHNEAAWAERLPGALRFLLGRLGGTPEHSHFVNSGTL